MTHQVSLSLSSGQAVIASQLDPTEKAKIIEELTSLMSITVPPFVINNGETLLLKCRGDFELNWIYNHLEEKQKLGPYRAKIKAKGMPFVPVFWLLEGLSTRQSLAELRAKIQSYLDCNSGSLGKWRAVYASCHKTACTGDFPPNFMGNVLIVTDAETMFSSWVKNPPVFQGIKPCKCQTAELPM